MADYAITRVAVHSYLVLQLWLALLGFAKEK